MLELAVLADDLTGGMIVASLLELEGVRCPVLTDVSRIGQLGTDAKAAVLARKIRLADPQIARQEAVAAAAAFKALGARQVYSKYSALFDSTPKGNIGPIAEELLSSLGAHQTLFCPAFIEREVFVFQGHMFVKSTPLDQTFKRHDPATPATSSNLVEMLQAQSQQKVGLISHTLLIRVKAAIESELASQSDTRFFICDAVDAQDIERIAELTAEWPLVTGGDSLVQVIGRRIGHANHDAIPRRRLLPPAPGDTAVIAGSCAPMTLAQLQFLEIRHPVFWVRLAEEGKDPGLADRIVSWAVPRLADGPIAVATTADSDSVRRAHAQFGREGASGIADELLGTVARRLYDHGVRKFVVAGGETSGEVLSALNATLLEVAAFDDMYGGYCHRRGPDPLSAVLKPGSFGGEDFLLRALARLQEADAATVVTGVSP
jgi:3-dehydrotetronate 4-kinase